MKLKNIDLKERPREKLIARGPGVLSNSELLAIMLDSGTKEESVLELSNRLISEYGFSRLFKMTYSELEQIKGIKEAKACKLMALFEIARRINCQLSGQEYELNGQTFNIDPNRKNLSTILNGKKIIEIVNNIDTSSYLKEENSDNNTNLLIEYQMPTLEIIYIIQ